MAELTTLLIEDGSADRLVAWHRAEAQARLDIAREILPSGADGWPGLPSYHLWVPLPGPWRPRELTEELPARGVLTYLADSFAVYRRPTPTATPLSPGRPIARTT